jgi:hypothetical protein
MDMVRFEQRNLMSELPVNWEKVGRDVHFK